MRQTLRQRRAQHQIITALAKQRADIRDTNEVAATALQVANDAFDAAEYIHTSLNERLAEENSDQY